MSRDYSTLMNEAFELEGFSGYLTLEDEKGQAKVQQAFNSARNVFVYDLLKSGIGGDEAKQQIVSDLSEMEQLQPEWGNTYNYVRQELLSRIDEEARKSPLVRKVVRWSPLVLGLTAIASYAAYGYFSGTPITSAIDTKAGIVQRASAFHRMVRYREMSQGRFGGVSATRELIFSPFAPKDFEKQGGAEFAGIVLDGLSYLISNGQLCSVPSRGASNELSDEEVKFVGVVADGIMIEDALWKEGVGQTVLKVIKTAGSCSAS